MKVPILNSYNPYINDLGSASNGVKLPSKVSGAEKSQITSKINENENLSSESLGSNSYNNIITKSERSFFMKLFPESSEQIEKHVVFNRSGRVDSPAISKGRLFDGKI